jgi:hypothetical protein
MVTEALAVFSLALVCAASVTACRAVRAGWPDDPLVVVPQPAAATATAAPQAATARLAGRNPARFGCRAGDESVR